MRVLAEAPHLGKDDEARRWLAQAMAWLERGQEPVRAAGMTAAASGGSLPLLQALYGDAADPRINGMDWVDRLGLRLLYRETRKSLEPAHR